MHFKKPKSLFRNHPAAPPAAPVVGPDVLITADAHVLITEDKNKFIALYQEYLEEYQPQGPTQRDLVEEMVAAIWLQRRCASIGTVIFNLTMDSMGDRPGCEFAGASRSVRTALAYLDQHGPRGALARVTRAAAGHTRAWHRALKLLRQLQNEKKQNEPETDLTPTISIPKEDPSTPRPVWDEITLSVPAPQPSHAYEARQSGPR